MLWLSRQLANIIANSFHYLRQLNLQPTTSVWLFIHTLLGAMSTSLLTTPDPSIVLVDNDLNWENAPALEN